MALLHLIWYIFVSVYEFKDIEYTESDKNYGNEIINDWSFRGISTTHEGYNPIVNQDTQLGDRLAFWVARRIMNYCQEIKYLHSNIEFWCSLGTATHQLKITIVRWFTRISLAKCKLSSLIRKKYSWFKEPFFLDWIEKPMSRVVWVTICQTWYNLLSVMNQTVNIMSFVCALIWILLLLQFPIISMQGF